MAEFLIYNKDHWMNKLTSEEMAKYRARYAGWDEKVAGQYQRGDVVEVRPDGFWTGPKASGFNKAAFRVISVPNLKVDTKYQDTNTFYKSRFKITTGSGNDITAVNSITDLTIIDKGA